MDGTFRELPSEHIGDVNRPSVGRGAAFGDLDNDGDIDVVISNNNEPANLLIRDGTPNKNWIGFLLIGVESNYDAIGARIVIKTDEMNQVKFVTTAGSYLAANDKRLLFGLNHHISVDEASIKWPSGTTDSFTNLEINCYYQIKEGGSISAIYY